MDQPPVMPPVAETGRPGPASDTSKLLAALGYPIWIVALIAVLIDPYKNEKFVKFHGFQALALGIGEWVVIIAAQFLAVIPVIGWIVALFAWLIPLVVFIYQIILAIGAYNGNYTEVPVVYGFVKGYIGE